MFISTSQDRRPPNIKPGPEAQSAPLVARVREADRETLRDFRDHLHAKGVSRKTLHTYVDASESFAAFCADHGMPDLENVSREHIEAWLRDMRERGNKPATVKNRFAGLRQLFRWQVYAAAHLRCPRAGGSPGQLGNGTSSGPELCSAPYTPCSTVAVAVLFPLPASVGGVAEQPDVTALPTATNDSADRSTVYAVGGAVALAVLALSAGVWARRRLR